MEGGLSRSTHKWTLVRQRTRPTHKHIRAQGCFFGPEVFSKEPIPQGGLLEDGQHNGNSPCEQQGWYPLAMPLSIDIGTLAMVPGGEHHDISTTRTRQVEHGCRIGIEGVQRQQRMKDNPQTMSPFLKGCEIDRLLLAYLFSWRLDPEALHADALPMDWAPFKGYAFPPFNLIPAVLNKVTQEKADIILVAPIWPAQPWWPLLLSLLVEQPVLLPSSRHLLRDPADPQRIHPVFPRLHLAVFHVSGGSTRLTAQ